MFWARAGRVSSALFHDLDANILATGGARLALAPVRYRKCDALSLSSGLPATVHTDICGPVRWLRPSRAAIGDVPMLLALCPGASAPARPALSHDVASHPARPDWG